MSAPGTLGEVIARMVESERRLGHPAPDTSNEVIRGLLAAVDNFRRALRRAADADDSSPRLFRLAAQDNLRGASLRLADAQRAAEDFLKPGVGGIS